ncbi:hypothetical protein CPLU01_15805 [Colletotrichum plurivorum]|uniref:Uncharacterized protein n=1 Tax=Colletotrichum plurivorum TaxID=2175906 RepID=A0A8H6MSB7_9PEZI|nr:hypothetical protein CPLU01_15805 [Colletotrichum plurivorum]
MTRTNEFQGNKKPDKTSKYKRNEVAQHIVDQIPDMVSTTNLDEPCKHLAYQLLKANRLGSGRGVRTKTQQQHREHHTSIGPKWSATASYYHGDSSSTSWPRIPSAAAKPTTHHPLPEPTDFVRRQTRHGVVKIKTKSAADRKTDEANTAHANAEFSTEQCQTWLYCESGQPGGSMTLTKHATDLLKELFKEAS